jgi:hypothetical protein
MITINTSREGRGRVASDLYVRANTFVEALATWNFGGWEGSIMAGFMAMSSRADGSSYNNNHQNSRIERTNRLDFFFKRHSIYQIKRLPNSALQLLVLIFV